MAAVLIKERSQDEYDEMKNCKDKEDAFKQAYLQKALEFREYYAKKVGRKE